MVIQIASSGKGSASNKLTLIWSWPRATECHWFELVHLDAIDLPAESFVLSGNKAAHWFIGSRRLPFASASLTAVSAPPETYGGARDKVCVKSPMHLHPKSQEHNNVYIEEIKETTWPPLIKHWRAAPEFSVNQAATHSIDVCSFLNLFTVLESFPSSSGVVHGKYTLRQRTAFSFPWLFLHNYSRMINRFVSQQDWLLM